MNTSTFNHLFTPPNARPGSPKASPIRKMPRFGGPPILKFQSAPRTSLNDWKQLTIAVSNPRPPAAARTRRHDSPGVYLKAYLELVDERL